MDYAVVIPAPCEGSESQQTYNDGWLRWDNEIGPKFVAYDSSKC